MSKGFIFSLLLSILWAFSIVNTRFILKTGENPLNLTVWMSLFTLIPWLFIFRKHGNEFKKLSRRTVSMLLFIGVAGSLGINLLQSLALQNTSAANFAFLYRTIVVFTIIFAALFLKERITLRKITLASLIVIGSYFLVANGQGISFSKGDIYTLMMAASAAFIANILIKHTISKMHPDLSGSAIAFPGAITLLTFAIITHVFTIPKEIFLIFIGSALYFFQIMFRNRAYKYATASFVTMVVSLTPFFVSILSFFLLHESLSQIQLFGGLIIVGSTILAEKYQI